LHSFRYTFLKETSGDHYPRFALYTLGGDNYNYVRKPLFAYGMGESNAFLADDNNNNDAVLPIGDVIAGVGDFKYTNYYSIDAPSGCSTGAGAQSCWFAMLTDPASNIHQRGHRGIVVRNFRGRLNGEAWPRTDNNKDVSPFTFNLIKSRQNNAAKDTVSIELGLPSSFKAAVDSGHAKFLEGDYLEADIELLVPPRQNADYFGKSQRLRSWLTQAGVDSDYAQGWKIVAREAFSGDGIRSTVFEGDLERMYHPRIRVDCSTSDARFNIEIPEGTPGILPITIAGVGSDEAATAGGTPPSPLLYPLAKPSKELWRYDSSAGAWKEFATGPAAYQLEKDVLDNSFTFVYSLSLEFTDESSGPPVVGDACEQFFFGSEPPTDTNPACN